MVRLLAFALFVPKDDTRGTLQFARGLSDTDEPDLWQHDLSGQLVQWIEVGQPDERRMLRAASRAEAATFIAFQASTPVWWAGVKNKLQGRWAALSPGVPLGGRDGQGPALGARGRTERLSVWQLPSEQSQALAALAQRSMQLQVSVQDGTAWCHGERGSVETTLQPLLSA
jgi:uncharacterized protein YaeQ